MTEQQTPTRKPGRISRKQVRYLSSEAVLEERGPSRLTFWMVFLTLALICGAVAWANFVPVVTSAKTSGEIIPFGKNRVVQHLEGGIVKEINVKDGDIVTPDQILVKFEPAMRAAELAQVRAREASLEIRSRRIRAFLDDLEPEYMDVAARFANQVEEALFALKATRARVKGETAVLQARIKQRKKAVDIYEQQARSLRKQRKLVAEAVTMRSKLFKSGHGSRVNLITSQLELSKVEGSLTEAQVSAEQARAAITEAENQLTELNVKERNKATEELSGVLGELAEVRENIHRLENRVQRLDVTASVGGVIHGLQVNTSGAVVQPGQVLMTIVPMDEGLIVETRLSPRDIGYVRVGQTAKITITGFDARRYGHLTGKLAKVSANTFSDEKGAPYFKGRIMLDRDYVLADNIRYPVVPGMTVQADITTGSQNLLRYLTRPVYVALEQAFSER
ncbi:MAG: HlyD family type I secretion periplasmic adaptor subunit [Rhodospirillaceae bacterium]|jgi:membrane fusion protein, adhesin transport system|nr:HlyD family type I secretion periplasmic adaptor subunit [Rhodospirillaceae bacterium]